MTSMNHKPLSFSLHLQISVSKSRYTKRGLDDFGRDVTDFGDSYWPRCLVAVACIFLFRYNSNAPFHSGMHRGHLFFCLYLDRPHARHLLTIEC